MSRGLWLYRNLHLFARTEHLTASRIGIFDRMTHRSESGSAEILSEATGMMTWDVKRKDREVTGDLQETRKANG